MLICVQRPLLHPLFPLRAIINHFNPKIESYAAVNHISQLSEEQVNSHCSPALRQSEEQEKSFPSS